MAVDIRHHKIFTSTPVFEQVSAWMKENMGSTYSELIESMRPKVSLVKWHRAPVMTPPAEIKGESAYIGIIDEVPNLLTTSERLIAMADTQILPSARIRELVGVAPVNTYLIDDEEY